MNFCFKWKLSKTNRAVFIGEDGSVKEMPLDILYQIIPFIQLGDCGRIIEHNGRPKFVFVAEDQEEEIPLQLTHDVLDCSNKLTE